MPTPVITSDPIILKRNLAAVRRFHPALADRLDAATPTPPTELAFTPSKAGPLTAAYTPRSPQKPQDSVGSPRPLALASRYDPLGEAQKTIDAIDFTKAAAVACLGLGLGYHAAAAFKRLHKHNAMGLLLAFEPHLPHLKAVLTHLDHSAWLAHPQTILADPDTDRATLFGRAESFSSLITQGTHLLPHPAARRLSENAGESIDRFAAHVQDLTAFCRTNVATALVNSARTCRNLAHNLPLYAAGPTTNPLHNLLKTGGDNQPTTPAICVSAGPSLAKNIHLLTDPDVRRNVILIAVQTALQPLLERGVKPDFVTALDYSPICTRFYEGLPPLPDVTLVVDPKVNPAVVDAFPGPVRTLSSEFNDKLLAPTLNRPITKIPAGATVAHLSFYLAQHLGANPIILLGQDLAFSDGLYYCPGTAVHRVWEPELNPFNTVEMMEWTRIVRMRGHLRRTDDIHGNPVFTDEQMVTYLKQFERDFAKAKDAGTTVLDCTEGGTPKEHTEITTLADALQKHATHPAPEIPLPRSPQKPQDSVGSTPTQHFGFDPTRLQQLEQLLTDRINETQQLRQTTQQTIPLLNKMRDAVDKPNKFNPLHDKLQKLQRRVEVDLHGAFEAVNHLNTIGAFKRLRADRIIRQTADAPGKAVQAQQIERDRDNLKFLAEACDEALDIFAEALKRTQQTRKELNAQPTQLQPQSTAA
ncbi:MAG: 6-hydroxymethylpterin diphosphokinase MptE-like protein [Planctomycetota bacterium]